jgi:hypothetical protein
MTKKYYRAERRCFEPGEVMLPEGTYQNQFEPEGKATEKALEDERPKKKPIRKDCLFVFGDLMEAERYWRTHDGSCLYEVEIDEAAIRHCGDMQLVDLIGEEFRKLMDPPDRGRVAALAKAYWDEEQTTKPARELLVSSAGVVAKLQGKSDTKAWVDSQITKYNPADDPPIEDFWGIGDAGVKGSSGSDKNE